MDITPAGGGEERASSRRKPVAGADAVAAVEQKASELLAQVDAYRDLSSSLAVDEPELADAAK